MSDSSLTSSDTAKEVPLLKQRVQGPTINVHVHLNSAFWWKGHNKTLPPFDREVAVQRLESMGFDGSADELEHYVDRLHRRREMRSLADTTAFMIAEFDDAGIDTGFQMLVDQAFVPGAGGRQFTVSMEQALEESAALGTGIPAGW